MQDEIKKQTKEGSSYFTKENLLYAAAGAVIVGGVACALYPPCAAAAGAYSAAVGGAAKAAAVSVGQGIAADVTKITVLSKDALRSMTVRAKQIGVPTALKYIKQGGSAFATFMAKKSPKDRAEIMKYIKNM